MNTSSPQRRQTTSESAPSPNWNEESRVNQALLERPRFTIRAKIIVAFSLFIVLNISVMVWSSWVIANIQSKIRFLEVAGNYLSELQEARRYEKNHLLYHTNLDEAKEHLSNAEVILKGQQEDILHTVGKDNLESMVQHVTRYHALLGELGKAVTPQQREEIEPRLRLHGAQGIDSAEHLVLQERANIDRMLLLAKRVPLLFAAALVVLMGFIATFLSRQLLNPLSRFMEYTQRLGRGDFTMIHPTRRYSDEFSQLAMAFNHMIHELDTRHRILADSHKLRAIGTLVAGVAHELNNPLNNIMLTSSMLDEDLEELDPKEAREMTQDLIQETERALKIVKNLLDFARESETKLEPISLDRTIHDTLHLVGNQLKMQKIRTTVDIPETLPRVHGDEQMLNQVFVNLILNAAEALPAQGCIDIAVRTGKQEGFVAVLVKDNGHGIPPHLQNRIFDPFFTTKGQKRKKGTGLGLSVSLGILRKLGGTIEVESTEGVGTTFTVLLPITDVPAGLEDHLGGKG